MPVATRPDSLDLYDPILTAEALATDSRELVDVQRVAEFALGLAMAEEGLEIDATLEYPEAFLEGVSCVKVLSLTRSPEDVGRRVVTYLADRLRDVRAIEGADWQWEYAFPAPDRIPK